MDTCAQDYQLNTGYTLCGMHPIGWGPIKIADYGEKITCPKCLRIIGYCKNFKGGKQP